MAEAATAPETDTRYKINVNDDGPSRKKLDIEVPADVVEEKLGTALDTLATEAELPGFRKGRAPKRLIEKRFGEMIVREAKSELVAAAYSQAVEQNDLKVLGDPIDGNIAEAELERGKAFKFEVTIEVLPDFDMPSLEGIEIAKPLFEVTDEQVDGELEKFRINEGDLEERDAPEAGDYITGHGIMTDGSGKDAEEFYNIEGAVVRVPTKDDEGRGMILGVMVDDFEKQLGLPKPGETATIKVKGPQNHEREDIRGKDLVVTFEVSRVDRIIPAPMADIVAKMGYESEDELKEMIKTRLSQRVLINQQSAMRQQVAKYLHDNVEMEMPENLTAAQSDRLLQRQRVEMMYRGIDEPTIETNIAEMRDASADQAARELKLSFILNKAGDELDVNVQEAEVNGRIAQMAAEQGARPDQLRQQLIESRQVNAVVQQIREHKTIDAIIEKAKVTEMSADDFQKKFAEEG